MYSLLLYRFDFDRVYIGGGYVSIIFPRYYMDLLLEYCSIKIGRCCTGCAHHGRLTAALFDT